MKNRKKIGALFLLVIVVLALFGGCAKEFDAGGYTKAVLDVSYKNETEHYITITGSTKEAAEKIFSENMDVVMVDFEPLNLPKDLYDKFRNLFEDLVKKVKYTVGEAVKDEEENFTVDVIIEPISLIQTFNEFQQQTGDYASKVANDVMNGETAPTDQEMQNSVYKIYYDMLEKTVKEGLKYEKAETVTVHVYKVDGSVYQILEEDLNTVNSKMILQKTL